MADRLPWYKGVLLNGCKFGPCIILLLALDCMG